MAADGLHDSLDFFRWMAGQDHARPLGGNLLVFCPAVLQAHVVQQRGGANDLDICAFGPGQLDGQRRDPQHVIEAMRCIARGVKRPRLLDADQAFSCSSTSLQIMSATLSAA